ncbi:MAG: hypothetical protein R2864_15125 [Syntrophotaleaceae bacterium]
MVAAKRYVEVFGSARLASTSLMFILVEVPGTALQGIDQNVRIEVPFSIISLQARSIAWFFSSGYRPRL